MHVKNINHLYMHEIVNKKFKGGAYRKIISSTGPMIRVERERESMSKDIKLQE